jgi:hypothetical protein
VGISATATHAFATAERYTTAKAINDAGNTYSDNIYFTQGMVVKILVTAEDGSEQLYQISGNDVTAIREQQTGKPKLYPSPADDILNIETPQALKSMEICDLQGKTLVKLACNGETGISINVSALKPGAYLLKLTAKDSCTTVAPFIKK